MKKLVFPLLLIFFALSSASAQSYETIPCDGVDEDLYFVDGAYLCEYEQPEDLGDDTGDTTAEIKGSGTVIIGSKRNNGFPRIIISGGTTITSRQEFTGSEKKEWWEGELLAPTKTINPSRSDIEFEYPGNHDTSRINVLEAYQLGETNQEFSFSQDAYAVFRTDMVDNTRLWIAHTEDVDTGFEWIIDEEDFCIVKNKLCTFVLDSDVNRLALVEETYLRCPTERIANGTRGRLPRCEINCDFGYIFDYTADRCVRYDEATDADQYDMGSFDSFVEPDPVRPGYFRYRGEQLIERSPDGLYGEDLRQVNINNAVVGNRKGTENSAENSHEGIIDRLNTLDWKFWRTEHRGVRPEPLPAPHDGTVMPNEDTPAGVSETRATTGMLLPQTGPGMFLGLIAAGIGVMAFGIRRK